MKNKEIYYLSIILVVTLLAFQFDVLYELFEGVKEKFHAENVDWFGKGDMSPANRLREVVQEFGVPDSIDSKKGGVAVWGRKTMFEKTGFLERVELRDEMIPHNSPEPHFDFLYAYYHLDVPRHLVDAVTGISESVAYDPEMKLVRARCHFMGANYATLTLAMKIIKGELTGYEAKNAYSNYIFATVEDHPRYNPHAVDRYKMELKQYYEQHKVDCFPVEKDPDRCRA